MNFSPHLDNVELGDSSNKSHMQETQALSSVSSVSSSSLRRLYFRVGALLDIRFAVILSELTPLPNPGPERSLQGTYR